MPTPAGDPKAPERCGHVARRSRDGRAVSLPRMGGPDRHAATAFRPRSDGVNRQVVTRRALPVRGRTNLPVAAVGFASINAYRRDWAPGATPGLDAGGWLPHAAPGALAGAPVSATAVHGDRPVPEHGTHDGRQALAVVLPDASIGRQMSQKELTRGHERGRPCIVGSDFGYRHEYRGWGGRQRKRRGVHGNDPGNPSRLEVRAEVPAGAPVWAYLSS
jgi:hypothetical protein